MSSENIELKPTQVDKEKFKEELTQPPFIDRLSTKKWRDVNDPSYYQISPECRRPQEEE